MITKKISIFYSLTQKEIIPPKLEDLRRKEEWLVAIQKTVEADYKPLIVKVTYELYDPEVENMQRFFNGPVVEYFAIQSRENLSIEVDGLLKERTRETILDEVLGFDVPLLNGKNKRDRKSTADFKIVKKWYDFLETVKETIFDPQGYEFPDSEEFWESAKKYGYEEAKTIAKTLLVDKIKKRLSTAT
jgi:hypothetical protein